MFWGGLGVSTDPDRSYHFTQKNLTRLIFLLYNNNNNNNNNDNNNNNNTT